MKWGKVTALPLQDDCRTNRQHYTTTSCPIWCASLTRYREHLSRACTAVLQNRHGFTLVCSADAASAARNTLQSLDGENHVTRCWRPPSLHKLGTPCSCSWMHKGTLWGGVIALQSRTKWKKKKINWRTDCTILKNKLSFGKKVR